MDNLSLEALVREVRPTVVGQVLHRIRLSQEHVLLLDFQGRGRLQLAVSLDPVAPLLFLTEKKFGSETGAQDWILLLRKYLERGRVVALDKELDDRVIVVKVESTSFGSPGPERYSLVLELIPNKTNAHLLGPEDESLGAWRLRPPVSQRLPGAGSSGPPGTSIASLTREPFLQLFQRPVTVDGQPDLTPDGTLDGLRNFLSQHRIAGFSPRFITEILAKAGPEPESLWEEMQRLLIRVQEGPCAPRLYFLQKSSSKGATGEVLFLAPFPLQSLQGSAHRDFASMREAAVWMFEHQRSRLALATRRQACVAALQSKIQKKQRLLSNLEADLGGHQERMAYKKYSDLLFAQPEKSPSGRGEVRVTDLFDPDQRPLIIPLDERLSLVDNARRYAVLYQKANRAIPQLAKRVAAIRAELEALGERHRKTLAARTAEELDQLEGQRPLRRSGSQRTSPMSHQRDSGRGEPGQSRGLLQRVAKQFASSEGWAIWVGKSGRDNDILTFKVASSEDFWFHVGGYGGSHVILRNPEKSSAPPRQSILEAAQLAAYFSQARNAPKVEVHYTQRKFVSKPKGAKAGLVRLREYRSVSVRPQLPRSAADNHELPTGDR
ncbi:MAG: NFACT RNA binding domain-containing protein [Acidobacteriota bacterium]